MASTVLLAVEGVEGLSPDHIAADLAVPIGILIFSGAVFALLWSNHGARKGALIYGTAIFGFMGLIGVYWWFGAPGTPVSTGLQNFPGQAGDAYQPQWFPFEGGSDRAGFFDADDTFQLGEDGEVDPGQFQTLEEFVGTTDDEDPMYAAVRGDLDSVAGLMAEQYFPRNEFEGLDIGAGFRTELQDAVAEVDVASLENAETVAPEEGEEPEPPGFASFIAQVATDDEGDSLVYVTEDDGQRLAAAELVVLAEFTNADGSAAGMVQVAQTEWFAFKDPGALWLPSAVWTGLSFLLFVLCLALLDRIEQREKREDVEVEEAMDVQVPIKQ